MQTKFYYETIKPGKTKKSIDFKKIKSKAKKEIRKELINIKNMPILKYTTIKSEYGKKKVELKPKNLAKRRKTSILRDLKEINKKINS